MRNDLKSERIMIYFDLICGVISSSIAISTIVFFTITEEISQITTTYIIGLGFWIAWLLISLFFIGVGIYTYYAEKNYDIRAKSRKLRKINTPIVS